MRTYGLKEGFEPKPFPKDANKKDSSSRSSGPRDMHEATCADCGQTCQVPFKPNSDRPVYCSNCYQKHKPARSSGRRF